MEDNITTVQLKVDPIPCPVKKPVLSVMDKPSRYLIEEWVKDWGSKGHPYYLLITDDTPRDSLEEMTDYSFLKADIEKYSNILQPIWNDDQELLNETIRCVVYELNECYSNHPTFDWETVELAL